MVRERDPAQWTLKHVRRVGTHNSLPKARWPPPNRVRGVCVCVSRGIATNWRLAVGLREFLDAVVIPAVIIGYKVVVLQRYDDPAVGCPDPGPAYLDQWYGGVRGSGFLPTNDAFFTDTPYFDSGSVVGIAGGDTAIDVRIQPTPRCGGRPPTIIGTSIDDTIDGTAGDDIIVALGGDDIVRGLGGDDTICAGGGADVVSGGDGDDRIYGNAGADELRGNVGNDVIRGGRGKDLIHGGRGNDYLYGNRGNDTIIGGWGVDIAWGGPGTDTCRALVAYGCE